MKHKVMLTPSAEYKEYAGGMEVWDGDELLIIVKHGEHAPDDTLIILPDLVMYCDRAESLDKLLSYIEIDNTPTKPASVPFGLANATMCWVAR